MARYKYNDKLYDIPEEVVDKFESMYPDAVTRFSVEDDVYEIPVSRKRDFLGTFKNATPYEDFSSLDNPEHDNDFDDTDYVSQSSQNPPPIALRQEFDVTKPDQSEYVNPLTNSPDYNFESLRKKGKIETVKPNDKFGLISESINENRIGLDDEISNAMRGNVPEGIRPIDVTTNLISARNYLNEADDLIKARKEGGGVLRGMRDAASKLGTWDFGTSDLAANKSVYNALRKFERGEELSQDELRLLDAVAVNTAAKVYASDLGVSYDIGSGFVQSIPFMLEMIVNPLSGAGKGVGKALAGYAAKRFGGKVIPKVAGVAGRVVGDIAASTGMAATTGAAGVAADTYSRMIGSPVYTDVGRVSLGQEVRDLDTGEVLRDENGNPVKVGSVGKESIGSALYKSLASRSIDNFSEMFGSYFGPVGDILKETKAGKKISASALVNSMNKLTTADWTKGFNKIMQDAKYDGFFGETAEEYVGGLLNAAIVGDQSLEDLGSLDNLLQTAGTVGLMSGILGSVNLIGLRGVRYNARKDLERSEANGRKVFGDDFDVLKDELMNMDPDKRKDVVRDMIASDRFNMEQKKAIMDYFYRRSVYDGLANGESKKMDEATQAETEAIESESNPETGLYIEASRIDPLTKQLTPGTIVQGMMEDGKDRVMWKGPDGKVEMILKSEIDPSSVRSMQTQEIIDVSVNNIRESMRAEIERDSKYDPSIPSPEETIGQSFYVDGNPYAFFNENGRLNPYLVDLNGKPIKPVRNISVEDYYQAKQAEIDKQKVVQNSPVYKLSDGRIARLIDMDESDVALEILDRDGDPVGNISMTKEDFDNNASMQEQSPYERYVDTGDVDDSVVNLIADKISRGDALTPEEESMRQGASDRVESRLSDIRDQSLKEAETLNVTESISQSSNQGSEVPLDNQEPTGDIKPSVVMKEDGTPNFVSSGVDATLDFLHDKYGEKMPKKIEVTRKAFDEDLKKASEKLDKAQEAYDNAPIGKEDKVEAALIKARQEYDAIKVEADFWANLDDDIKEASKKPGDVIAKEISVMGDPMSGEELAAMMLANGAIKLTRDTYKKETGAGNNETARMFGLFASPEKGGVNIERAGEILELADKENGTNFFDENDTNAGRDAIIEVLSSAHTRGDLIDYVKRNREAIAERERQAEYNAYAEWCEENYHMSPEEYEAYEESMVRDFSEKQLTDEERGELDSQIADEIQAIIDEQNEIDAILAQNKPIENENIEGNDESGGDGLREGGGEVLPREQLDQTGGTGEVEGRESAGPDIDRTDGATQEGSSRGLVPFVAPSPKENETPLDYAERIVEAKRLHEEELKVDTNPTEAQKEAGNYKKGHIKINGFDVTIEQPAGSVRSGKDANGKEWSVTMNNTYGYIRGAESVDGDHIDVFLGPDMNSDMVYVVDQVNTDGSFDEHKVMMGFSSLEDARSAYLSNYEEGWQGVGNITGVALDEFKKWIDSSIRKTKPFYEYRSVDFIEEERPDSGIRFRETRISPEEENIIEKAKSDGSYMKAPNGNPTNLNEKQWVQVRTKAFKEWFGDWENNPEDASKVIDENGEPRVVYHGTYADFNAFDESHLGDVTDLNATNEDWAKTSHIGFWFNDNKIGFYTKHKPVFLNVRNPLEFASMESLVDEMSYYDSGEDFKRSNSDGYDSVIVLEDEEMGGRSYVVFNDNQIKSVTENNEDFSFHNDETSKNEAVKQASDIDGAHFRSIGDKDTDNLNNAETIESSINDWSNKLNTPVRVIHDVDDITDTDENMLARKRDSKGWYDTSTGEIVIVSPNSTSVGDAQRTFLHEVVGHHGLRELFGDDFDTFLDNVYRNANEDIRKNIIDRTKGNPLNLREATEEYIAELAERGFDNKADRSLWEKIKDAFLDMLRKAGISLDFKLSDNDLRYILWRSYKNLEQGNLMDVAEDTVMRNDLGIGDFSVRFREEEKEDINDLKKKNYRLNKKVDRLKDKIDELHSDSQLSEALKNELINEIQSRIDSKDASNINKEDLLSLLKQVKGAKTKADMEDKMLEVDRISNEIRIRSTQRRIDRLLALKTQDVNGKNMSIAKNVDDSTRRVFDFIRGSLSDIKISGYEQEMKDLRRRNRELTTLIEARGRMTEDTGLSGDDRRSASEDIVSFKKEMEDNKVRISELKNMAEDVRNAKANDLMGELEHMRKELEDKLNEAAEGKAVWSIEDSERKMALDILGISLDARDHEGAVNSINRDIMEKVRNNSSFYAAQMNRIRSMENPTEQKEARKNMKAGYNENKRRIRAEKRLLNETLRSRLEVLDNIESLLNDLVEGGRAALSRKIEEETYRRIDIVRNSIEDVADKPVDINNKDLGKMNWFKKFASSPLGSFDYMAQRVGRKFLNGDGYIYQRFVKGQEGTIAAENELAKNRDRFRKTFANKVNEIFNEDADSVLSDSNKRVEKSGVYIINTDTKGEYGRKIEIPMTKGEAMYVYMVWKMDDGRMKLEQQGFTDDSLLEIEDFIGENYKAFADWIQDDLLVNLRDRYNERYVDMYGTSMANIPNYAPLRINKNAVMNEVDLEEVRKGKKTLEEKANSLIKRTVNSKPIDLSTNGIEAVISHVRDMEEWYAFARVRRDLSWLLSSPTFRNKVNSNVNGHYVDFVDAAALASHSYHPDPDKYADEFFAKVNRGLVGANISFGLMTAAKQILSLPAFLGYSQSPKFMVAFTKNIGLGFTGRPYKWAMENMPMFYERVKDGNLGDEKLRDDGDNLGKIIESYLKIGMVPNKMIDAFTISVGAKSVYDYTYDKLRKGYERLSDDEAKRQALVDAEIFFNQTQQSGVETFLSPMQRSRTIINRMLTTYQNSNIGYVRRVMLSLYDLASLKDWSKLRSNYAERFKAEGMDDDTANQKAQSLLLNGARKQLFHFLLFGWGMNMLWDLGSSGFFGFFAGDDDEDEKYKDIVKFVTTPVKGVPAGNIINNLVDGYDINPVLFLDELQRAYNNIGSSIDDIGMDPLLAMDVLSNGSKLVGFDMERWGNIYLGMEGLIRNQGKEGYLLQDIMFLLNTPKSQRVKVAREMYKNEPFLDYAEKVSRAYRYTPMSNKWEYWVPGTDILTRSKLNKIKRNYVEDNMTSEQKAQDKERKEKEKEIRRIRELSIDKEAMERFVNK
ncbi:MAG: inorganic pyrophosphatase [Bacteriophage sp.]|nr:MAG: inorganic pyrophosphatase [Bacteriophage sp.]